MKIFRRCRVVVPIVLSTLWPTLALAGWQTYAAPQGLFSSAINAVFSDRAGAMWFGTAGGGVSRFDATNWTTYRTADGLLSDNVTALAEDAGGTVWIGTDQGLSRFDGHTWINDAAVAGIRGNRVNALLVDRSGVVWVGTSLGGLLRWDGVQWTSFNTQNGFTYNNVSALCQDHTGTLWVGFNGYDLRRFDGTTWTSVTEAMLGAAIVGTSITEDTHGVLWVSGGTILWQYNGVSWTAIGSYSRGLNYNYGTTGATFADRDGGLWVAETGHGVSRFDGRQWRNFARQNPGLKDNLASDDITAMAQDLDGNLWFATALDGATRYDGSSPNPLALNNGTSNCFDCGLGDRRGYLWFAIAPGRLGQFDGQNWTYFGGGPGEIHATLEDSAGLLWFGGNSFDRSTSTWSNLSSGIGSAVLALCQDQTGRVWAGTDASGVWRYSGGLWVAYNAANTGNVLSGDHVTSLAVDDAGLLWLAVSGGLATFDGFQWATVRPPNSGARRIDKLLVDHLHRLWLAEPSMLERLDPGGWTLVPRADSVVTTVINSFTEDRDGNFWLCTSNRGVVRYNGSEWGTATLSDGLESNAVGGMVQDTSGTMWFEFPHVLSRFSPDRRAPRSVATLRPPPLSAGRNATANVAAAWAEVDGIQFSTAFDGGTWSDWSGSGLWTAANLLDGTHRLLMRSRDKIGNAESSPLAFDFVIDATPPAPRLDLPSSRQVVRDSVAIVGTTADARLGEYRLQLRPVGGPDWDSGLVTLLARGTSSIVAGRLASWNTHDYPDGDYDLRLAVTDTLGLTGATVVGVTVDNQFPGNSQTAPALVSQTNGGDIYTTRGDTHLYFAPHAFEQDAMVSVTSLAPADAPATLPSGAEKVSDGEEFSWSASLLKPASLAVSLSGVTAPPASLAFWFSPDSVNWTRVGGTVDEFARHLLVAVTRPGRYALYSGGTTSDGAASLSALSFTPRVFSPSGNFASSTVAISFSLGRAAPVTVRVYSRSGRMIREVASALPMSAGSNLVQWDGRTREGEVASDGLYLVTVEALGQIEKKPLAVVK